MIASLAVDEVWHTTNGVELRVPARPAAWWMSKLVDEYEGEVSFRPFALLASTGSALLAAEAGIDLGAAAEALISAGSGRPVEETYRLISVINSSWDLLGGKLVVNGVDASKLSFAAWLDAAWYLIRQSVADSGEGAEESLREIVDFVKNGPEAEGSMDEDAFAAATAEMSTFR